MADMTHLEQLWSDAPSPLTSSKVSQELDALIRDGRQDADSFVQQLMRQGRAQEATELRSLARAVASRVEFSRAESPVQAQLLGLPLLLEASRFSSDRCVGLPPLDRNLALSATLARGLGLEPASLRVADSLCALAGVDRLDFTGTRLVTQHLALVGDSAALMPATLEVSADESLRTTLVLPLVWTASCEETFPAVLQGVSLGPAYVKTRMWLEEVVERELQRVGLPVTCTAFRPIAWPSLFPFCRRMALNRAIKDLRGKHPWVADGTSSLRWSLRAPHLRLAFENSAGKTALESYMPEETPESAEQLCTQLAQALHCKLRAHIAPPSR